MRSADGAIVVEMCDGTVALIGPTRSWIIEGSWSGNGQILGSWPTEKGYPAGQR